MIQLTQRTTKGDMYIYCSQKALRRLHLSYKQMLHMNITQTIHILGQILIIPTKHVVYTRTQVRFFRFVSVLFLLMLASHFPEVDTRWSYECGIFNFARNSSHTLISANQQQKSLRCLPKVTRLHSNTTRRFQEGISKATRRSDFKYDIYTKAIRRYHDDVRRLHGVVL